jgi:hypothetical protein
MTTLSREKEQCFICGKTSEYTGIGSTNRFGSPDLDTRPPEMQRSTITFWIRCCPSCGFCAPKVSHGSEQYKEIIRSEKYLHQLENREYTELANSFLCWVIIQEEASNYAMAGWSAIHAAWACDDAKPQMATSCRNRAIELFQKALTEGDSFAQDTGAEEAILADLFRRSGQFDKARTMCEVGIGKKPTEVIEQVLNYQIALAAKQDTDCHTINQAMEYTKNS